MLFNSFDFGIFFAILYLLYVALPHRGQNLLLLVGSYFFYGCWDWRFLSLIVFSTVLDYVCGLYLDKTDSQRIKRRLIALSVSCNLGLLAFFKYFGFFAHEFQSMLLQFGVAADYRLLNIVLPVGISFYTFQTMSYTIDIYRGELKPTRNILDFALFVAFFPQLVAGPIERAKRLLPQISRQRTLSWSQFHEGCYLIFWGLFLKVFVADNLATLVDPVFSEARPENAVSIVIAVYCFAFQIFGDFAGYSNIARGLGKCMGFDIMVNFRVPYFAQNPKEFWQRWHISLSSWLRDYLYIPLGGNRSTKFATLRNLFLTMLLGGLWHGAGWTFIVWGLYQGSLLIIHKLLAPFLAKAGSRLGPVGKKVLFLCNIIVFFQFTCLGWLIFRAESMSQLTHMVSVIFGFQGSFDAVSLVPTLKKMMLFAGPLCIIQVFQYWKKDLMVVLNLGTFSRACFYYMCFMLMMIFGVSDGAEFIYFQF